MKRHHWTSSSVLVALLLVVTLSPSGCIATPPFSGDRQLLAFLHDGSTTRTAVVERLGEPSAQLRDDKIPTYRIVGEVCTGHALCAPHATLPNARHSLVLVFNDQGFLQRQALVKIS